MPTKQELLAAALDPEYYKMVGGGVKDALLRGAIGGALGTPVDMYSTGKELLTGRPDPMPVGGSEWFGQQMQNRGLVSPERNQLAESLAYMLDPYLIGSTAFKSMGKFPAIERALAK